jgi:RNA polymerase sigma-70 factor (ECF subfamily)
MSGNSDRVEKIDCETAGRREDREPAARWFVRIEREIHDVAERFMRRERRGHTLQPTALISEAYIRLARHGLGDAVTRAQFLAAAAGAMRRILIDHARKRKALKRGGDLPRMTIETDIFDEQPSEIDILALVEAIDRLGGYNSRFPVVVQLKVFGEMTEREIAEVLGVSDRVIKRDWRAAKLLLLHILESEG